MFFSRDEMRRFLLGIVVCACAVNFWLQYVPISVSSSQRSQGTSVTKSIPPPLSHTNVRYSTQTHSNEKLVREEGYLHPRQEKRESIQSTASASSSSSSSSSSEPPWNTKPKKLPTLREQRIWDAIHGWVTLPDYIVAIVSLPEFQALKHVRQLGNSEVLYPEAQYTRYTHSIGVCYLGQVFLRGLQQRHPLDTYVHDKSLIKSILLALVTHDIGHVAYSHLFDQLAKSNANMTQRLGKYIHHEHRSVALLGFLARQYELPFTPKEIRLAQRLIIGDQTLRGENIAEEYFSHHNKLTRTQLRRSPQHNTNKNNNNNNNNNRNRNNHNNNNINEKSKIQNNKNDDVATKKTNGVKPQHQTEKKEEDTEKEEYPTFVFQVVHDVVMSIDLDKFDYLWRDAHNVGVPRHLWPDIHLIMNSAELREITSLEDLKRNKNTVTASLMSDTKIFYNAEGQREIEYLMNFRHHMFQAVYRHPLVVYTDKLMMDVLEFLTTHLGWTELLEDIHYSSKWRHVITDETVWMLDLFQDVSENIQSSRAFKKIQWLYARVNGVDEEEDRSNVLEMAELALVRESIAFLFGT